MREVKAKLDELLVLLASIAEQVMAMSAAPQVVGIAAADAWMRADEVMALLKVSRKTLYNYVRAGAIETRRFGGTLQYCRSSVMRMRG